MSLISEYILEQKRYSKEELKEKFNLDNENFIDFVKKLKAYGVLKMVNNTSKQKDLSDLIEEDVAIVDIDYNDGDYYYIFTFVGVLTMGNKVIKCVPKYLLSNEKPLEEMKEILKVLEKYNADEQIIHLFNGYDKQKEFNLLAVILYLLRDYNENGIYSNQQDIIETNGDGEILWENTINDTFAIIVNNRPFYPDLQTKNSFNNKSNYISRLHKFIITDCCKKLKEGDLLDIFEIEDINISDEKMDDFGEIHYILYKLFRELNMQYVTRKQILLKTLYSYILHRKSFNEYFGLSMYGTNSFNLVWEKVCAQVFDNKLSTQIGQLNLPQKLHDDYQDKKDCNLLKIIHAPIWKPSDSNKPHVSEHTLTPDLVSLFEIDNGMWFCIFDAKYYNIKLNKNVLQNYPGVRDVSKQYLYQLAFNDFIYKHEFSNIKNAFLMPGENKYSEYIGKVEMDMFKEFSEYSLERILIIKLSAQEIYKCYLNGNKFELTEEFIEILNH